MKLRAIPGGIVHLPSTGREVDVVIKPGCGAAAVVGWSP